MGYLESFTNEIQGLCENHKVRSLYSFGSVNTEEFNLDSDIDLLVDFAINDPFEYSDNYFDLKFELERILNRSVDLLENKAIKNPFLRDNINKSKVLLYGH